MGTPPVSDRVLKESIKVYARCNFNKAEAARILKIRRSTLQNRLERGEEKGLIPQRPPEPEAPTPSPFAIDHAPQVASVSGAKWVMTSTKDNKFVFGAMGDLHAASKYTRWEVREDLMQRAVDAGASCIFDTGNWIDGEKPFNRYDLEVVGLDSQIKLLSQRYPKVGIPTYAVAGDDHEGWYCQSDGIDVGRYCESVMQDAGHDWHDLGYMESDIVLKNANSGATQILRVAHPGGGSSYATSYRPQKIVECVPLDSEILTRSGWRKHDEIAIGDVVLGYNIEADLCEWTEITDVHKGRGSIVRYSNDQFDVRCTPDHRWAIEWESRAGANKNSREPACYSRRDRIMTTIDSSKERSRIIQAAMSPDGPGMPRLNRTEWLRRDLSVQTVLTMTSGERRAFIEGMLLGEGTLAGKEKYRTVIFSQRPGPVCDAFRLACFLEGIATTDRAAPPGTLKPDSLPTRRVVMLSKRMRICDRLDREELGEQDVWCVTTKLGTWAMRQGDLITITGNCLEGGEKPAVLLLGHYHKLDCNNIRNVWAVQTGTQQDQTPFMRKKGIEAHVGGAIIEMEQDPKTGAIIGFKPDLRRYFNRAYYVKEGRANNRWGVGKISMIPRKIGRDPSA